MEGENNEEERPLKRTLIGGFLMLGGLITTLTIILAGSIYATSTTAWTGSKWWYAIFGGKQYGDEFVDSLFLVFPFIVGLLMTIFGLFILGNEYYKTFKR